MTGELLRQEALKLATQRFPYLMLALVLALQTARMLALAWRPPATSLDVLSAPQLWAEGMGWALRFAVYLLLVLGAMSLSREFSLGTAKTMLVLPVSRHAWVVAKLLLLLGLGALLVLLTAGWGALLTELTLGWQSVAREGLVLVPEAEVWRAVLGAVVLSVLFVTPVCAFALLIGMAFTSSGAAVGMALVAGLLLEALGGLFAAGRYLFTFYLTGAVDLVGRLGRGLPTQWEPLLRWGLPVSLISLAAMTALLLWWMGRRDITE